MGRHKEFDQEKAVDQALELFWEKGYESTSIQDLCDHLGIHRGSLYDTFGDKHELFLACLDPVQPAGGRKLQLYFKRGQRFAARTAGALFLQGHRRVDEQRGARARLPDDEYDARAGGERAERGAPPGGACDEHGIVVFQLSDARSK